MGIEIVSVVEATEEVVKDFFESKSKIKWCYCYGNGVGHSQFCATSSSDPHLHKSQLLELFESENI